MNDKAESEKMKHPKLGKALNIVGWSLAGIFAFSAAFLVIVGAIGSKSQDGAVSLFGKELLIVKSDSMAKCEETDVSEFEIKSIPVKSCVFVEKIPEEETKKAEWLSWIRVGDVLTFRYSYSTQETITHRVISIKNESDGGYEIRLKGDNVSSSNALIQTIHTSEKNPTNYLIGKVTGQSYMLGCMVWAIRTPLGMSLTIIVPCMIVVIWNVVRISVSLKDKRKEKKDIIDSSKDSEIEELKKKLKSLEATSQEAAK